MRGSPDRPGNLTHRAAGYQVGNDAESGIPFREQSPPKHLGFEPRRRIPDWWRRACFLAFCCLLLLFIVSRRSSSNSSPDGRSSRLQGHVLVSYSYFEKDDIQRANAEFFWKVGMGINSQQQLPSRTDFVVIVQGTRCSPCEKLRPLLKPVPVASEFAETLSAAWAAEGLAMLWRAENEGMDFGAHNVTLEWLTARGQFQKYKYFIFLNSSVKGPFYPSYMPAGWQWTDAFLERLEGDIRGVSSSLVCLPHEDAGGYGAKMESWAYALDTLGLSAAVARGVFRLRSCKLCADEEGIVVRGEYGLTKALLDAGHNVATLMGRYRRGVDWRDPSNWGCNDNVHPSRHGTYDGISMHPLETLFVKASWHVGEPHLSHYSRWFEEHAEGHPGTSGSFNDAMYHYAISEKAQEPNNAAQCFKVPA